MKTLESILFSLLLFTSIYAQEGSIGGHYMHPSSNQNGIGINTEFTKLYHPDYYKKNYALLYHKGKLGVIQEGNINGRRYVDANFEFGFAYEFFATRVNFMAKRQYGGIYFQLGLGGATPFDIYAEKENVPGLGVGIHALIGVDAHNSFHEEAAKATYEIIHFKLKNGTFIHSENQKTIDQLFNENPNSFDQKKEVVAIDSEKLYGVRGGSLVLQSTLIPIKKNGKAGYLSFSGKLNIVEAHSKTDGNTTEQFQEEVGTKTIDLGNNVIIKRDEYVYTQAEGSISPDAKLKISRIDTSIELAYSRGKIRIWLEPNYTGSSLNIIGDLFGAKSLKDRELALTVGLNYRFLKK